MEIYEVKLKMISENLTALTNSHNLTLSEKVAEVTLKIPYDTIFYMFFLPILACLILFLVIKFMPSIKKWFIKQLGNFGYIEIWFINTNRRINVKMIKLDEFSNFSFKGGKYSLEKMSHFIVGYKNNIPVFLYDRNFILPLVIQKQKINDEIRKQYEKLGLKLTDTEVSAISIKLEPTILELVYSKKLISDLYSVVKDDKMEKMLIYILIGCAVIGLLYYTGMLEKLLDMVGIHIGNSATLTNATTNTTTTNASAVYPYTPKS